MKTKFVVTQVSDTKSGKTFVTKLERDLMLFGQAGLKKATYYISLEVKLAVGTELEENTDRWDFIARPVAKVTDNQNVVSFMNVHEAIEQGLDREVINLTWLHEKVKTVAA